VASGQRRDPYDWEWREAEYERRRQRTRGVARRRGRLRLAAVVFTVAAVVGSALLAAQAVSLPAPRARAEPFPVTGATKGAVAVLAPFSDEEAVSRESGLGEATWASGQADAASTHTDRRPLLAVDRRNSRFVPLGQSVPATALDDAAHQFLTRGRPYLGRRAVR
jgi:hypothetical protein